MIDIQRRKEMIRDKRGVIDIQGGKDMSKDKRGVINTQRGKDIIKDKRGVIAKALSTLPVFLIIVFIIALFLVLTSFTTLFAKPTIPSKISSIESENILLKEIKLDIDGRGKKILVFDALIMDREIKIEKEKIEMALGDLLMEEKKEGHCIAIAQGGKNSAGQTGGAAIDDFLIEFEGGEISSGNIGYNPLRLRLYEQKGLLREISFKNINEEERIYLQYYYGRCLE